MASVPASPKKRMTTSRWECSWKEGRKEGMEGLQKNRGLRAVTECNNMFNFTTKLEHPASRSLYKAQKNTLNAEPKRCVKKSNGTLALISPNAMMRPRILKHPSSAATKACRR